jgi:hypothetical protein
MIAYKLVRKMKDGQLSPLFINKKSRLPLNEWMKSENHPTKGFKERQGWHCTLRAIAPHLKVDGVVGKNRVWVQVEVEDYELYDRPESQGGTWVLADKMKIIDEYVITNELLDPYIYETIGGIMLGVNYPDEHDSVIGYYETRKEARQVLTEWFTKNTIYKTI